MNIQKKYYLDKYDVLIEISYNEKYNNVIYKSSDKLDPEDRFEIEIFICNKIFPYGFYLREKSSLNYRGVSDRLKNELKFILEKKEYVSEIKHLLDCSFSEYYMNAILDLLSCINDNDTNKLTNVDKLLQLTSAYNKYSSKKINSDDIIKIYLTKKK